MDRLAARTLPTPENLLAARVAAMAKFCILDFEASSLSRDSWPIEVGISWIEDGGVKTWSSLIRPAPGWDLGDWSRQSAEVHGIPRDEVMRGPVASEVAKAFLGVVNGRRLVSDAPEFDGRWLRRLVDAGDGRPMPDPALFDEITFGLFEGLSLDHVYERLARSRAPHRAGPDAERMARGWLAGLRHIDRQSGMGST